MSEKNPDINPENINDFNPFTNPIKITCEAADSLPLASLKDFQGNLKRLPIKSREKLLRSICVEGFMCPVFIWRRESDNMLLDGHQRIKTLTYMQEKGWDIPDLPVVYIEAANEKEARRKLLKITSQYGEFELDELNSWLADMEDDIQESIRLVDTELEIDIPEDVEETEGDDDIPEDVEPITKPGDLWELNNHRLLCGDSTKVEDVERLMNGQKADMVFTDPPYGVDYDGGHATDKRREKLENDNDVFMYDKPIKNAFVFSTDNAPIYLWFADRFAKDVINGIEGAGYQIRTWIIWNKNLAQFGAIGAQYKSKHEPCIYAFKKNRKVNWCGPNNETTVWDIKREAKNEFHPTQKPVSLSERAFNNHSVGKILDIFAGSGSTLISSEKNNKTCFTMDLSTDYCDVIVHRYIDWMKKNGRDYIIKRNGEVYDESKTDQS